MIGDCAPECLVASCQWDPDCSDWFAKDSTLAY